MWDDAVVLVVDSCTSEPVFYFILFFSNFATGLVSLKAEMCWNRLLGGNNLGDLLLLTSDENAF